MTGNVKKMADSVWRLVVTVGAGGEACASVWLFPAVTFEVLVAALNWVRIDAEAVAQSA